MLKGIRALLATVALGGLFEFVDASIVLASGDITHSGANHCEFYVDSLRTELSGHYGFDHEVTTAVLVVHPDVEFGSSYRRLRAVGNWLSYEEGGELRSEENVTLVEQSYDPLTRYQFRSEFLVRDTYYDHDASEVIRIRRKIIAMNFFIELVNQDGGLTRLWLHHSGENFNWQGSFAEAVHHSIPYGYLMRADHGAPLFDAKGSCQASLMTALRAF